MSFRLSVNWSLSVHDHPQLSDVCQRVKGALSHRRRVIHSNSWSVTKGTVVGNLLATPKDGWSEKHDFEDDGHDDWFPEKIAEIISKTQVYCDILSLTKPDGKFLLAIKSALETIARNNGNNRNNKINENKQRPPIIIRILYAKIVGFRTCCKKLVETLTENISPDANIQVYAATWRNGISWNHAKIIAVDGSYLWTGGHNFWHDHYLRENPAYDLGLEMAGDVAHDAHLYANTHWKFIERLSWEKRKIHKKCTQKLTLSSFKFVQWPHTDGRHKFPPRYRKSTVTARNSSNPPQASSMVLGKQVNVITMGRFGAMYGIPPFNKRSSDDGIVALLSSAKKTIRLAIQDIGPVCIGKTKLPVPGSRWPKKYLNAIATAIYDRHVTVQICLSNPHSIPANLSILEAQYGNGWSCNDVASRIVKHIVKRMKYHVATDKDKKRKQALSLTSQYLQVCTLKNKKGNKWSDGMTLALHAKHFIVDDKCFYIGSQNLYDCDLAEWGVLIDDEESTLKAMNEYWNPMWESSYTGTDVNDDTVMKETRQQTSFKVEQQESLRLARESYGDINMNMFRYRAGPLTPSILAGEILDDESDITE